MGRERISTPQSVAPASGRKVSARKKKPRRATGVAVLKRTGFWHLNGTVACGKKKRRLRESTKLPATPENIDAAEEVCRQRIQETINELVHGIKPTVSAAVGCLGFLNRERLKPMSEYDIWVVKEVAKKFRHRPIREITDDQWKKFVMLKQAKNSLATRERFLNSLCAFLAWCADAEQGYRDAVLPVFRRFRKANSDKAPPRRRVTELTPELIVILIEAMPRHIVPQLAVEWSTGHRVSTVLMECRLCDVKLEPGLEEITFLDSKNDKPWTAALHPWAAQKIVEYLAWRGNLEDKEGALFLTDKRQPYGCGPKGARGRNKTGFNAGKRKAVALLKALGREADAILVAQVTQHWFRHWLATHTIAKTGNIKAVMEQQGWLDSRSPMRYIHDVSQVRRDAINSLPIGNPVTHAETKSRKKSLKSAA